MTGTLCVKFPSVFISMYHMHFYPLYCCMAMWLESVRACNMEYFSVLMCFRRPWWMAHKNKPTNPYSNCSPEINVPVSWRKWALCNQRLSTLRSLSPAAFDWGWTCSLISANMSSHTDTHTRWDKQWVWPADCKHVGGHSTALHTIRMNWQHQKAHKYDKEIERGVDSRVWTAISELISCWKEIVGNQWCIHQSVQPTDE